MNSEEQWSMLQPHYFLALDVSFMTVSCKNRMQPLEQRRSFWNTDARLLRTSMSVSLKLSPYVLLRCSSPTIHQIPKTGAFFSFTNYRFLLFTFLFFFPLYDAQWLLYTMWIIHVPCTEFLFPKPVLVCCIFTQVLPEQSAVFVLLGCCRNSSTILSRAAPCEMSFVSTRESIGLALSEKWHSYFPSIL